MSFLVDANVLSEAIRKVPEARVLRWMEVHDADLHLSVITLGEIEKGILKLQMGSRRRGMEAWLRELRSTMTGRILPFGEAEASAWAHYFERQRAKGRVLPTIDSMLAATAKVHGMTMATRNIADFPDVLVTDPWSG